MDPAARPGIEGARHALGAFLRVSARGDATACRYVAPGGEFAKTVLRGDCQEGVRYVALFMSPHEREALSSVRSTTGHLVNGSEAVLPFTGLRWKSGGLTVETLQEAFVLRRTGGRWKIVA